MSLGMDRAAGAPDGAEVAGPVVGDVVCAKTGVAAKAATATLSPNSFALLIRNLLLSWTRAER
jgi:hypothetical protein